MSPRQTDDAERSVRLTVVIPCLNEAGNIAHHLSALAEQAADVPWEVVVADNGSTDGTRSVVEGFEGRIPRLRMVDASQLRGAAHARNVGARSGEGAWLVFCDADDVPGEGWLRAMADALSQHPAVVPRFEGVRLNGARPDRPLGQQESMDVLWYPPFLRHAGGSGIGVWRTAHQEIGGFDEGLRCCEDTDYCVRLQRAGFDIFFQGDATLHIRYPESQGGTFWQARLWARSNTVIYKRYGKGALPAGRAWRDFGKSLWKVLKRAPKLRDPRKRTRWVWQAGWHLGLLEGALRYRVAPIVHPVHERSSTG